jgi:hypothetical protein
MRVTAFHAFPTRNMYDFMLRVGNNYLDRSGFQPSLRDFSGAKDVAPHFALGRRPHSERNRFRVFFS